MMFKLKPLSPDAITAAQEKVRQYRALNEPWEAESICRDILETDSNNHEAHIQLILALSDQFDDKLGQALEELKKLIANLSSHYERAYYAGLVTERRAKTQLARGTPGAGSVAYEGLRKAMEYYENAESLRPAGDDNAILRWNTCARLIMENDHLRPEPTDDPSPMLE